MTAPPSLIRIWGMMIKEFRQIGRDSRVLRVIFVSPLIQLVVFGYAVSTDIWHTPVIALDHNRTQASRALLETLSASGYFQIIGQVERPSDMVNALDHGDALLAIEIPPDFSTRLRDGSEITVQILLDGTQTNTARVAQGYAERIIQDFALRSRGLSGVTLVDFRERAWFNPDLASRNYNVPAVVGGLILLICLLLTSLAVVREREIGTLEQLRVSPLTPGELIAGKTIPFGIIGLVDLTGVTLVALGWFDIPFRGSVVLLLAASVLYILSGLGLGLLISTVSSTQQEAFMASFLLFMPTLLLSGFMFPVSSMPEIFQWITWLNPVRHYIEIVRSLYLKGSGLDALWVQYAALLAMGLFLVVFAARQFRIMAGR